MVTVDDKMNEFYAFVALLQEGLVIAYHGHSCSCFFYSADFNFQVYRMFFFFNLPVLPSPVHDDSIQQTSVSFSQFFVLIMDKQWVFRANENCCSILKVAIHCTHLINLKLLLLCVVIIYSFLYNFHKIVVRIELVASRK